MAHTVLANTRDPVKHQTPETEDDDLLADYFEKSATAVRDTFGRFEQGIARPVVDHVLVSFHKRPIRSTFVAFYFALSALPVLSFIGFSLFVFATFIFLGIAAAIFTASCAVGLFGFWLACMLIFFLILSFNLTVSALATYAFVQFVLRARQDGSRAALSALANDTRAQLSFVRGRKSRAQPTTQGVKTEPESETETLVIVGSSPQEMEAQSSTLGEKVPGVPIDAPA